MSTPDPSTPVATLVLSTTKNHVTTLRMNMPARLNGWTLEMMAALRAALGQAANDDETRVVILTGTGPYYCAGVNLGATLKLAHPRALRAYIVEHNQGLFDSFLDFPKPILVAANGPAIGASVTSATLCDGIIASEKATFSTPFATLGVPPEGCSSVLFPRLLGDDADRMLGEEGWKPTAAEAKAAGLVQWVVPHDTLEAEAQRIAEEWAEAGAQRSYRGGATREELKAVNAEESQQVATAFLGSTFLRGQFRFLWGKKKRGPALMFLVLRLTRPAWSLLL
jgi:peroxisomal 3,2-trans-enoyl-CoA isomerase